MKAKLYIGILSAVLLPGFISEAQIADSRNYRNDDAGLVVNNYYNYDYYYSSRINRFHRSFSTFSYYSPVFIDSYWYNYQPYSWGISIYGNGGLGFGVNYNYPLYYDYGWSNPYFGGSYYRGYSPFYYNWYSPFVLNIRIGNLWPRNYYSWWNRDRWDNDYRQGHNFYNNYYNNFSFKNYRSYSNASPRGRNVNEITNPGNISKRNDNNGNRSQTEAGRNTRDNTNNGLRPGETRRNTNPSSTRSTTTNTGSRRNLDNVNPGNSNNVNRRNTTISNQDNQVSRGQGINNRSSDNNSTRIINSNTNRTVGRSQTSVTPTRRSSDSEGKTTGSVRSGSSTTSSSSSAVRSGSSSSRNSGTKKSSSRSSSTSSSSTSKTRRR